MTDTAQRPDPSDVVCIVEDDSAIRDSLRVLFEAHELRTECFASGRDLFASGPIDRFGCFVVDYRMPQMDGLCVLETIRSRRVYTPAVLLTSAPDDVLRRKAKFSDVIAVLDKPVDDGILMPLIKDAIGA